MLILVCRSVDAPILLDTIRTALPEGVQLACHQHKEVIRAREPGSGSYWDFTWIRILIEILHWSGSLWIYYLDPDPYEDITVPGSGSLWKFLSRSGSLWSWRYYLDPDSYGDITVPGSGSLWRFYLDPDRYLPGSGSLLRFYLDPDPYWDFT